MLPNNLKNAKSAFDLPPGAAQGKECLHVCRQCGRVKLPRADSWVPVTVIPYGTDDDLTRHYAILFISQCYPSHPTP